MRAEGRYESKRISIFDARFHLSFSRQDPFYLSLEMTKKSIL